MKPDVSIIIVNYHTSALLAECIQSIFAQTSGISFDIRIVDNNSEPDLKEKILSRISPDFHDKISFIFLNDNVGFGNANNEALKFAEGRNIFFLNPDTLIQNNAIAILSDFLDSSPQAGACGSNLVDADLKPSFSFKRFQPGILWELDELANTFPQKILFGKNRTFNYSGKPLEVRMLSGAALMIRGSVIEKTGAFRPDYFLYFEDTDLCHRINKAGYRLFNIPEAIICHLESKSFSQHDSKGKEFKIENLEKSRKLFYLNNNSFVSRRISSFLYTLFLLSRILLTKNKDKRRIYKLRRKYFNIRN